MLRDKIKNKALSIKALVLFCVISLSLGYVGSLLPTDHMSLGNLAMLVTSLIGLVNIIAARKFIAHFDLGEKEGTDKLDLSSWILICLMCFMLWLFGGKAGDFLAKAFKDQGTINYQNLFNDASIGLVLFSAWVVGPCSEEFVFRGMLFSSFKHDMGAKKAAMLTAILFVVVHKTVMHIFFTFGLGMLLAYVMQKTNSIKDCILLHMGFNISSMVLSIVVETTIGDTQLMQIINNPFVCIGVSICVLIFIYIKFISSLPGKKEALDA